MFKANKYLSILGGVLFFMMLLMTGCAKEEALSPLSEDETFKSMEQFDAELDRGIKSGDCPLDEGDITDDEDDEDDTDRSDKH